MDIIDLRAKKLQTEEQKQIESEREFIRRKLASVENIWYVFDIL